VRSLWDASFKTASHSGNSDSLAADGENSVPSLWIESLANDELRQLRSDQLNTPELQGRHAELAELLSARASVRAFAQAAVTGFIAVVLWLASWRMSRELNWEQPWLMYACGVVAALLSIYAVIAMAIGLQKRVHENISLKEFYAIRKALGLDLPP
jgi:hypothetical protein